ncbi:hypothetical protein PAXINDRAFT_12048 [Paxillus involutus ATCC 200175]|uniref:Uncharacterized protein n=1 Tax=Paxillus involutus ATCC 200175 TaxID=664439 RepID=A0A0C9SYN0_PAXIN|nr:hypothetical protein PAXINDRAFT_12048 [Paxillus involutus ATCC 200175]
MPALHTRNAFSQSLEAITDTIHPPSLAIIGPTSPAFIPPLNKPIPVLTRPQSLLPWSQISGSLHSVLHSPRSHFFSTLPFWFIKYFIIDFSSRDRHLHSPHLHRHPYRAQT